MRPDLMRPDLMQVLPDLMRPAQVMPEPMRRGTRPAQLRQPG